MDDLALVELLLRSGASPLLVNDYGHKPIEYCDENATPNSTAIINTLTRSMTEYALRKEKVGRFTLNQKQIQTLDCNPNPDPYQYVGRKGASKEISIGRAIETVYSRTRRCHQYSVCNGS